MIITVAHGEAAVASYLQKVTSPQDPTILQSTVQITTGQHLKECHVSKTLVMRERCRIIACLSVMRKGGRAVHPSWLNCSPGRGVAQEHIRACRLQPGLCNLLRNYDILLTF